MAATLTIKEGINCVWVAIRSGNRKVAGYFVDKGVDKFGFGFNFLHKEVKKIEKTMLIFFLNNL